MELREQGAYNLRSPVGRFKKVLNKKTDKENNMVSLCGAFLYLYKMAELKDFLNLALSDDENEKPDNFETIHWLKLAEKI